MSEEILEYSRPYRIQNLDDNMWDDCGKEFKDDLIKNRITNIKIYYSNENDIKERYIIGLTFTFMNVSNGKIKVIEHKGTENISGMKELNIKGNEYLSKFNVYFKNDTDLITKISFSTNRGNTITVGNDDGKEKEIKKNNENKVYIGSFGAFKEKINSIGAIFTKRENFYKPVLFRFLFLRFLIDKNEKLKKECESKYNELSLDYKFYWRTINLPNACFSSVIKFCII